jgi:exodeoxyribonuclease V
MTCWNMFIQVTNCRLVLAGDTAQLPPVGLSISPALEAEVIEGEGFGVHPYVLTEVVRQAAGSGILACATQIRRYIEQGNPSGFLQLNLDGFSDVIRISGADLD